MPFLGLAYDWVIAHRRIVALKLVIAVLLIAAHFDPQSKLGLLVNLVWLLVF